MEQLELLKRAYMCLTIIFSCDEEHKPGDVWTPNWIIGAHCESIPPQPVMCVRVATYQEWLAQLLIEGCGYWPDEYLYYYEVSTD